QMNPATPPLAAGGVNSQTIRQIVPATIGGSSVRLRISNAQGERTLRVQDVFVGLAAPNAGVEKGTARPVTFSGASSTLIPAGSYVLSDPVAMTIPQAKDLAVSFFVPGPSGRLTMGQSGASAFVADGNVASTEA